MATFIKNNVGRKCLRIKGVRETMDDWRREDKTFVSFKVSESTENPQIEKVIFIAAFEKIEGI